MIDTDKYEGHTPAPWEFKHINSNWYQCDKIGEMHMEDIAIEEASVNAQLIADAPLLLEEVKRLLEENALLASQIRLAYEWVEAFHNEGTMISFIEHVYGDEEE